MKNQETQADKNLSTIGEKVRFFRMLKGLKQIDVAEKLGIDVKTFQNIESGKTDVPISRLQQIAGVFEVELFELLGVGTKNFYYVHSGNQSHTKQSTIVLHSEGNSQLLIQEIEKLKMQVNYLESQIADKNTIIEMLRKTV